MGLLRSGRRGSNEEKVIPRSKKGFRWDECREACKRKYLAETDTEVKGQEVTDK